VAQAPRGGGIQSHGGLAGDAAGFIARQSPEAEDLGEGPCSDEGFLDDGEDVRRVFVIGSGDDVEHSDEPGIGDPRGASGSIDRSGRRGGTSHDGQSDDFATH
jgi:hypothetical protein